MAFSLITLKTLKFVVTDDGRSSLEDQLGSGTLKKVTLSFKSEISLMKKKDDSIILGYGCCSMPGCRKVWRYEIG